MLIYQVIQGDTVNSIAESYGLSPERIVSDNGIMDPNRLAIGQAILLRMPEKTVTVQAGDTLYGIARENHVSVNELYRRNPLLEGRSELIDGEALVISYRDEEPIAEFDVNGYTYPSIEDVVLRSTLPYLSYLTSFSYGFRDDGSLISPADDRVLAVTSEYPANAVMLLSTLREDGSFSSEKADRLLNDPQLQETLFASIIGELGEKRMVGIDVDFEYVSPDNRQAYADFIASLKKALSPYGYTVFVSLAPKTSSEQRGLLYEAHDYALLGEAADKGLLMTYEWGYRYSPPMAVAPIDRVRAVVEYATGQIEPQKLFLGLPNYGYDWPLPFVQGQTAARSLPNTEAMDLAGRYGAEIKFSETAKSPYFNYTDEGGTAHEVWFEDVRSIRAKLELAAEYGLGGVSVWNMLRYFPGIWSMIDATVRIRDENEDI